MYTPTASAGGVSAPCPSAARVSGHSLLSAVPHGVAQACIRGTASGLEPAPPYRTSDAVTGAMAPAVHQYGGSLGAPTLPASDTESTSQSANTAGGTAAETLVAED